LGGPLVRPGRTETSPEADHSPALAKALSYAERKEQQKRRNRAEKAVKESEAKIEKMEQRIKELDELLMQPENASDMTLVTEYTSTKKSLDEEVERWEQLSETLESIVSN
jgi:ATP-binding cassette subfamily F protein 3